MRLAICSIGLVLSGAVLVGCGQSGNLQLANSPDYDKRAKYLLYSNNDSKSVQTEKKQWIRLFPQISLSQHHK